TARPALRRSSFGHRRTAPVPVKSITDPLWRNKAGPDILAEMRQLALAAVLFAGPALAEAPAGTSTLQLPIRLHARYLAPAEFLDKDGNLGRLTAYLRS